MFITRVLIGHGFERRVLIGHGFERRVLIGHGFERRVLIGHDFESLHPSSGFLTQSTTAGERQGEKRRPYLRVGLQFSNIGTRVNGMIKV